MSETVFGGSRTEVAGEAPSGRNPHFAHVYESQREQFATIVPFVRTGIAEGDRCIYCYDDNDRDELLAALKAGGVPVESALEDGQLVVTPARDVYLEDGEFEPERMHAKLDEFVAETEASDEFDRLRVTGENTWLLDGDVSVEQFFEYEAGANHAFGLDSFIGLCQFPREPFDDDALADVLRTHPRMAFDGCATANDHFEPPEEFDPGRGGSRVDATLASLRRQTAMARTASDYRSVARELSGVSESLEDPSAAAVVEPAVELARNALGLSAAGFWLYDASTETLDLSVADADGRLQGDARALFASVREDAWDAFTGNEPQVRSVDDRPGSPVDRVVIVPVDDHGVLAVAGTSRTEAERTVDIAMAVRDQVASSLDGIRREREIRRQERALERRTEALKRLNGLHETIRRINAGVLEASTVEAARELVCEELTDWPGAQFAWIGEYDRVNEEIEPATWAGTGRGYLDGVGLTVDESSAEPAAVAVRQEDPVLTTDVVAELHEEAWRREALARGFRAVAAVPLVYGDLQYGVLAVYADQSDAFGEPFPSLLAELGQLIAYVFTAIERKKSLLTDRTVQLSFEFRDARSPIVRIARDADCELELEGTVPKSRRQMSGFFRVAGGSVEAVADAASTAVAVEDHRIVEVDADGGLVQLDLQRPFVATVLAEHGVTLRSMTVDESGARADVAFPDSIDTRTVVQVVSDHIPDAELVSKHEHHEPTSVDAGEDGPTAALTDRQLESLRTAYHAGYFEVPRQCDGQEVAEMLDVTAPTFHQHRRLGIGAILRILLDD